jgi:hypothetical protein
MKQDREPRRYILTALSLLALSLGALAAFNIVVDPYLAYRLIPTPTLDRYKNTGMTSRTKSEAVRRGGWEGILLGSSRVEVGLDPHHPALHGARTYNLGLSDTTLAELAAALAYALENDAPSLVVLFVDLELLGEQGRFGAEFARSPFNPDYGIVDYHASNVLGMQATEHSIDALVRYRTGRPAYHDSFGRMVFPMKAPDVAQWRMFERALRWRLDAPPFHYRPELAGVLDEMLASCLERNVRLVIATPPMHASALELYHRRGSWDAVELWKRDLVRVAERANGRYPTARPVEVWDFAGFWSYNTEAVPPAGDVVSEMHWHWEATHFKKELGDVVLARILAEASEEPTDFGVRLSAADLERHLAETRRQRERWLKTRPPELRLIEPVELPR